MQKRQGIRSGRQTTQGHLLHGPQWVVAIDKQYTTIATAALIAHLYRDLFPSDELALVSFKGEGALDLIADLSQSSVADIYQRQRSRFAAAHPQCQRPYLQLSSG